MATGDTNAPEDHEAGTVGGSSGRGAGFDNDRSDRNKQPRSKGPAKLPSEYAEFKLADGRTLRDVMGDKFFGSVRKSGGGKWLSKGVREKLLQGNFPRLGGKFKNFDPERLTALKARFPNARVGQAADRRSLAEVQRAEQQARRDEMRARVEERRGSRPGNNFTFGGG